MAALLHCIVTSIEHDRIKERIATWRKSVNANFKCVTCTQWLPIDNMETAPLQSLITAKSCKQCLYEQLLKAFIKESDHIMEQRCGYCGCIELDYIGKHSTKWKTGEEYKITLCETCMDNHWVYLPYLDEYNDDCPVGCNCETCVNKRRYEHEKELVIW